jgi:hypothetical protein
MRSITLRCPLCGWPFAWHDDGGVGQPKCPDCMRREQDKKAAERKQED